MFARPHRPHGLPGLLYWWALYPVHLIGFTRLAQRIAQLAQSLDASRPR